MKSNDTPVGIIGAGSFGMAVASLISQNRKVLIYTRTQDLGDAIHQGKLYRDWELHPNMMATNSLQEVAERCYLIFPIIPSSSFRALMKELSPFLRPDHILIHGIKGLEVQLPEGKTLEEMEHLTRDQVKTMTEIIQEESVVKRIGCIAGPNLSKEIKAGYPAATVVASRFEEVINEGIDVLRTENFRVHSNRDLLGIELCGVLKNIMAIGSGMVTGLGFGENTRSMLIARGLAEMALFGKKLGATPHAFLGLAGVGDLVATCNSPLSRNYSVGKRLAEGESLHAILGSMTEVAEGIKTVQIATKLANHYRMPALITKKLYQILFEDKTVEQGMQELMNISFTEDVEFL
ncbi:MAG: NAD(P)-dependent glycerol-3-phosphate dehydrogenase [Bacteroidia bacterium]|nr:NAD(P)-dependent glycerol-3-phosphate dehydrogenase [Bacteroidia bacterium]